MNEGSYEEYKKELHIRQKKRGDLHDGKVLLAVGVFMLLFLLYILPFHAENVRDIGGDELAAGTKYDRQHVYYIEDLRILCAKIDVDEVYCIGEFYDCAHNRFLVSVSPGNDKQLEEQIRIASSLTSALDIKVSGYFLMGDISELSSEADAFYDVFGKRYADEDGQNMLPMDAKYVCGKYENYTLHAISHPGVPLASLVAGLVGLICGGFLFFKNRPRK